MPPPDKNVQLPDGRIVAFPGSMGDDDISSAIHRSLASDIAANPPGVQRPQVNMQPSTAGSVYSRLTAGPQGTPAMPSKVPPSIQNASPALGEAISGITGLGAAGMGAAAIPVVNTRTLPFLGALAKGAVKAAPSYAAMEGIRRARAIPYIGHFIPPGAELLPFLMGGKGKEPAAEAEPAAPEAIPRPSAEPAESAAPPPVTRQQVSQAVDESLGVTPLQKNVPLREQLPFTKNPQTAAPTGSEAHIPVESSAINSYRYNPQASEFHVITKSGQEYVYGDVSPDQVQEFEQAESKGKAFGKIKGQSPLVRKGTTPVRPVQTPSGDLTDILTRSLRQVQGNQ